MASDGDDHPAKGSTHVRVHPHVHATYLNGPSLSKRLSTSDRVKMVQAHAKSTLPLLRQLLRLLAIAAAVVYVTVCVMAVLASVKILRGLESRTLEPVSLPTSLIAKYAGASTLDKSPLVQDILGGDTSTARADAIYLDSTDAHSFSGCSEVASFNSALYGATYLRFMFGQMQSQLVYNVTLMADLELVAPVVDCTFPSLVVNDVTLGRAFFLARRASDPSSLLLLSTAVSIQNYISSQFRRGPALLMSIAFITDMSASSVDYTLAIALNYPYEATPKLVVCEVVSITTDGFWQLRSVPVNPLVSSRTDIFSARREGFYIDDPQSQSNIKNYHWNLFEDDPVAEVSVWRWHGRTVLRDSWAWAHCIHAIFAFYTAFQLSVLFFVMARRFRSGHIWIGDAFSSISSALLYRGVLVLISNQLNGFYTWTEYALAIGYPLASVQDTIFYRSDLLFPDLLTIYFNVTSVVSYAVKERIDPLLAFGSFAAGFYFRADQAKFFSTFRDVLVAFADVNFNLGEAKADDAFDRLSPFRLRTVSHVDMSTRGGAMAAAITSIITGLVYVALFIVARKVYRFAKRQRGSRTAFYHRPSFEDAKRRWSGNSEDAEKPQLTLFESARGAALQKRFGVISSYDNYVDVNGRRYATADAVYSNGFLVANRKFLVATSDLLTVLLIKLTRVRFKNVFVYELMDGDTAKQTARLLYPHTIQWSDLFQLDVTNLA